MNEIQKQQQSILRSACLGGLEVFDRLKLLNVNFNEVSLFKVKLPFYFGDKHIVQSVVDYVDYVASEFELDIALLVEDQYYKWRFDKKKRTSTLTYPDDRTVINTYNKQDFTIKIKKKDGSVEKFKYRNKYDKEKNVIRNHCLTDKEVNLYEYNEKGLLIKETNMINVDEVVCTEEYIYNEDNLIIEKNVTDDEGDTFHLKFSYDMFGELSDISFNSDYYDYDSDRFTMELETVYKTSGDSD